MMTLRKVRRHVILLTEVVVKLFDIIFTVERELSQAHGQRYSKLLFVIRQTGYKLFPVFGVVYLLLFLFACLFV